MIVLLPSADLPAICAASSGSSAAMARPPPSGMLAAPWIAAVCRFDTRLLTEFALVWRRQSLRWVPAGWWCSCVILRFRRRGISAAIWSSAPECWYTRERGEVVARQAAAPRAAQGRGLGVREGVGDHGAAFGLGSFRRRLMRSAMAWRTASCRSSLGRNTSSSDASVPLGRAIFSASGKRAGRVIAGTYRNRQERATGLTGARGNGMVRALRLRKQTATIRCADRGRRGRKSLAATQATTSPQERPPASSRNGSNADHSMWRQGLSLDQALTCRPSARSMG